MWFNRVKLCLCALLCALYFIESVQSLAAPTLGFNSAYGNVNQLTVAVNAQFELDLASQSISTLTANVIGSSDVNSISYVQCSEVSCTGVTTSSPSVSSICSSAQACDSTPVTFNLAFSNSANTFYAFFISSSLGNFVYTLQVVPVGFTRTPTTPVPPTTVYVPPTAPPTTAAPYTGQIAALTDLSAFGYGNSFPSFSASVFTYTIQLTSVAVPSLTLNFNALTDVVSVGVCNNPACTNVAYSSLCSFTVGTCYANYKWSPNINQYSLFSMKLTATNSAPATYYTIAVPSYSNPGLQSVSFPSGTISPTFATTTSVYTLTLSNSAIGASVFQNVVGLSSTLSLQYFYCATSACASPSSTVTICSLQSTGCLPGNSYAVPLSLDPTLAVTVVTVSAPLGSPLSYYFTLSTPPSRPYFSLIAPTVASSGSLSPAYSPYTFAYSLVLSSTTPLNSYSVSVTLTSTTISLRPASCSNSLCSTYTYTGQSVCATANSCPSGAVITVPLALITAYYTNYVAIEVINSVGTSLYVFTVTDPSAPTVAPTTMGPTTVPPSTLPPSTGVPTTPSTQAPTTPTPSTVIPSTPAPTTPTPSTPVPTTVTPSTASKAPSTQPPTTQAPTSPSTQAPTTPSTQATTTSSQPTTAYTPTTSHTPTTPSPSTQPPSTPTTQVVSTQPPTTQSPTQTSTNPPTTSSVAPTGTTQSATTSLTPTTPAPTTTAVPPTTSSAPTVSPTTAYNQYNDPNAIATFNLVFSNSPSIPQLNLLDGSIALATGVDTTRVSASVVSSPPVSNNRKLFKLPIKLEASTSTVQVSIAPPAAGSNGITAGVAASTFISQSLNTNSTVLNSNLFTSLGYLSYTPITFSCQTGTAPAGGACPSPNNSGSSTTDYTGAIVGGTIGGVVFFIILLLLILYCLKPKPGNAKPAKPEPTANKAEAKSDPTVELQPIGNAPSSSTMTTPQAQSRPIGTSAPPPPSDRPAMTDTNTLTHYQYADRPTIVGDSHPTTRLPASSVWEPVKSDAGEQYFWNKETNEVAWQNPETNNTTAAAPAPVEGTQI